MFSSSLDYLLQTCCTLMHVCYPQTTRIIHQAQGIIRTTHLNCLFSIFPGVLWLCIVAESLYLTLLFTGGALMTLEQCPCFSVMNKLKLSAFAALCTALSGNSSNIVVTAATRCEASFTVPVTVSKTLVRVFTAQRESCSGYSVVVRLSR